MRDSPDPIRKFNFAFALPVLLVSIAILVGGAIRGWPLPAADDLTFLGPAIGLVEGKGFTNRFMPDWQNALGSPYSKR